MTGVAVATSSLDVHWYDTYFVVAHFHFIMVGGTLTMFLAACLYWFPKMFGRCYAEGWALAGAAGVILGFIFTFTPQFLLGNAGMLGGLAVMRLWSRVRAGRTSRAYHPELEAGALYWHLVDSIWIFLWPLFYLTG